MSSYRSGSVGRFDYSVGSGSSSSRYRPSPASSSYSSSSSRYIPSSTATNPIGSSSIGGGGTGISRSYRAASYDPFSSSSSGTVVTSYRSPYNRESGGGTDYRPSATTMSNSYSDYTSKSRFGGGASDRYGSGSGGGYKPSSSIMSSSYTSALPSSSILSSAATPTARYKGSTTTANFPPPRSTSYASGLSFEPTSTSSRYGIGMSSSTYTPSTPSSTSYYSRPRIDYRSQTPSSITREPPITSRFDREYRSMSRFDTKEPSVDRVEETFSKLYNRYVRSSDNKIKTPASSSSSSSTTSSNQNSPIVKKFISHSEAEEEEFSCESEPEAILRDDYTKSLLQKSKVAFTLPEKLNNDTKEKTPTPGTAAPNKVSSSKGNAVTSSQKLAATAMIEKSDKTTPIADVSSKQKIAQPLSATTTAALAATTKVTAAIKSPTIKEKTPDKGSTTKVIAAEKPISTPAIKAASPNPSSKVSTAPANSRSKSPAPVLTKASFEEKYKDLPKTEVKIEPKQIKGTSELDKLLRIAEFEKNPNKILSTSLPKVIQSAVKAGTPAPAKPIIEKPVKASSEAPISATVKVKETIPAVVKKEKTTKEKTPEPTKKAVSSSKEIKKEKTPEPSKTSIRKEKTPEPKSTISVAAKKETSEKPRSRSKSPAPPQPIRSRSKSPSVKSKSAAPAEKQTLASKRAQRRERTIEMEKYVNSKLEQAKAEQEAADKVTELPKVTSERKPPLLLVTQPSVPSTPISLSANISWNSSNPDGEGSESEWDEEDEEAEDEEFYSEDDYDFTISLPSTTGIPRGDLYPVDESSNRLRSITPYSDYDSEFEIPFIQPDSRNDSRGRVSQSNAAPPPIFLASVTYDGQDEWGSKNSGDSDPDESQYFTVGSRLGVDSAGSRTYLSPIDFPDEEDEYLDNVDVGCTLTLLDKAAMKGSDEETDSEFYSEYSDEEYTEEEYSYYEDEEEEYYTEEEIEEEVDEEWEDDIEMTASLYLPPTFKKSESLEPRSKTPEPIMTKSEVKKESTPVKKVEKAKTPEPSKTTVTKEKTPEPKKVAEIKKEKTPEPKKGEIKKEKTPEPSKTSVSKEKTPEPKKAETKISKEKTPEPSSKATLSTSIKTKTPEPTSKKENEIKKVEKAKTPEPSKTSITKEKTPEPKKAAEIKKEKTPEPSKTVVTKEKTPEPKKVEIKSEAKPAVSKVDATKNVTKPSEALTTTTTTTTTKPQPTSTTSAMPKTTAEDKSAIRKSTLNMAEIERKKAEEKQAEINRQNSRLSGAVTSMRDRFRDPTPPKATEKITYKRSKLLQAREEIRPKRVYAPIVKPVLNDEFDKQMEEIREKMKKGSHKLQREYTNLSKGINSEVDERKLKHLESKHKDLIGNTQTLLTKAEEEKKRFSSKNESETEKRYRETMEKEEAKLRRLEEEKQKAMLVRPEPKRTVRRSKKKAEEEAAKVEGLTEPLIAASKKEVESTKTETAAPPAAPKIPASLIKKGEEAKPTTTAAIKVEGLKKPISTAASVKAPTSFIPETKKDDSDLEFIAAAMAKKKPITVSESVMKSEAGGVASMLRRKAEKAASPIPNNEITEKSSPEKVERGPRRYSARRKTEEIIQPLKIESKQIERKRKVQPHRKNRYTKRPFDIDEILGWENENWTFEKMEEFFEKQNLNKRESSPSLNGKIKKRRIEAQKVWISELKDIDKIYKASELRDIKMTAVS